MKQSDGPKSSLHDRRVVAGFSLVELMIALVISLFLLGGVSLLFLSGRVAATDTERLSRAQESLRFAGTFLMQDLRMAGYRYQGVWSDPYLSVTDGEPVTLRVRYQTPRDCTGSLTLAGDIGDTGEFLEQGGFADNSYFVNGASQLVCRGTRGVSHSEVVLLDGVTGFSAWPVPGAANPVALDVELEVRGLRDDDRFRYDFRVALRNRVLESLNQ